MKRAGEIKFSEAGLEAKVAHGNY